MSATENLINIDSLNNILAYMPGVIYWKDVNGYYLGCNNNFMKLMGHSSKEDIIGKTDYDFFPKEQAKSLLDNDQLVLKEKTEVVIEEEGQVADGSLMKVMTTKLPLFNNDDEICGVLGISIDITAQKKAESALRKAKEAAENANKVLSVFAAAVAHELRTPLTTIGNNIRGISRYIEDLCITYEKAKQANLDIPFIRDFHLQEIPKVADVILDEVNLSQSIININLAQVGIDTNTNISIETCHIQDCVDTLLERYPFKSQEQKQLVHINIETNFAFACAQLWMTHVLLNLLKNALYFIEKADKGEIYIYCYSTAENNVIEFKDTSTGIAPEILPKIFDQFFSARQHGAGIGLAFCKQVLEKFNGTITCDSVLDEYTCFKILLPKISKTNVKE